MGFKGSPLTVFYSKIIETVIEYSIHCADSFEIVMTFQNGFHVPNDSIQNFWQDNPLQRIQNSLKFP